MRGAAAAFILLCIITDPAVAEKRALLIGIEQYENIRKLGNPGIDVATLRAKLSAVGYTTTLVVDPDTSRAKIIKAVGGFLKNIDRGDEVLVYYSGHGVDLNGNNLLVPADSPSSEEISNPYDLEQSLISMRFLMRRIRDYQPAVQIWIIDACRENPYEAEGRPFASAGGLSAFNDGAQNTFVFFSASYSQLALEKLPNEKSNVQQGSPFSRTFTSLFDEWKDKYIVLYADEVRRQVMHLVNPNPQQPIYESGLINEWCFSDCASKDQQPGSRAVSASQLSALVEAEASPLRELAETQKELVQVLQRQLSLNEGQLRAALKVIGLADVPPEQIGQALGEFSVNYKKLLSALDSQNEADPAAAELEAKAQVALENGDLQEADSLLAIISGRQDIAVDEEAVEAAAVRARRAAIARTSLQFAKASELFTDAALRLPADEKEASLGYLTEAADMLYRQGDEFGANDALRFAAERYQTLLTAYSALGLPNETAMIQTRLAQTYLNIGLREDDINSLRRAVEAQTLAAKVFQPNDDLRRYIEVQVGLGKALQALGQRTTDLQYLARAVETLEKTQVVAEQHSDIGVQIRIQLELSELLRNYGWRLQEQRQWAQGLELIEKAIEVALSAAERASGAVDNDAAVDAMNAYGKLGDALQAQGFLLNDPVIMRKASVAYYNAVSGSARDKSPRSWGEFQHRLGVNLRTLGWQLRERGQPEEGNALLGDALKAFDKALEVRSREHWPLDWASTRMEIGQTLFQMGLEDGVSNIQDRSLPALQEAVDTYRLVLEERTRSRVTLDWAETQHLLGIALRTQGWRLAEAGRLKEAEQQLREAVEALRQTETIRTRERWPLGWAYLQWDLGQTYYQLGKLAGLEPLRAAIAAYDLSLEERSKTEVPTLWADTYASLGAALWELAIQSEDLNARKDALIHLELARAGYREAHQDNKAEGLMSGINILRTQIAELEAIQR